mgnify:CR=1 FL=1
MNSRLNLAMFLSLCLFSFSAGALLGQLGAPEVKLSHTCGTYPNCPASAIGVSDSTGEQVTCNLNTTHSFRICTSTGDPTDSCPPLIWYCTGTYGLIGRTCKAYFDGCPP